MSDSSSASLMLSPRDAQFVAAALHTCASLLNPNALADLLNNEDALERLFLTDYSAEEFNALLQRSRTLVPEGSFLGFVDGPLMASTTTLVS